MEKIHEKTEYIGGGEDMPPRTPMAFIKYVSTPHMRWAFGALAFTTIAAVLSGSVPYFFKKIIDTAQAATEGATATDVLFWIGVYIVATVVIFAGHRLSGFVGMQWASRLNATAYNALFNYVSRHSHSYFTDRFAGSLSSKISHASEGAQSLTEALLWNYYPTVLSLLLTMLYMATVSPIAAALFLCLIIILIPLNIVLSRRRRPYVVEYSQDATTVRGRAVDAISNIIAVRQFARREFEIASFNETVARMRQSNLRQWRMSEWILVINNVLIVLFEAAILLTVYYLWSTGTVTIGDLVMILTLLINIIGTLVFIGSSMNGFIRRYGEIEEGLTDVLVPHEINDRPEAVPLKVDTGKIEWQNVSFSFAGNQVFTDFGLTIQPGQRVGLVGPSGAGKSTFVSLLLRQHEIDSGAICIDGQNIAAVTQDSLRENIAVVPQEPLLFHRSIRENIAYGKSDATEEEVVEAAKNAQAHDFIIALPEGYETLVGERGVKLSGGQRQRIAIARAMLKQAPILMLDEATSALDSESEVAIQKALHVLMEGKTVIAIAHRLSTLREMDRILVLDAGVIVEDGTHSELVKQGGLYASLWAHQAGGFLQE